jgi:hypothetical protein
VYFKELEHSTDRQTIKSVKGITKQLDTTYTIKGVFIDKHGERSAFEELLSTSLSQIDCLYVTNLDDEFDIKLLTELARVDKFRVIRV